MDGITGSMAMNLHKLQKIVKDRDPGHDGFTGEFYKTNNW